MVQLKQRVYTGSKTRSQKAYWAVLQTMGTDQLQDLAMCWGRGTELTWSQQVIPCQSY